MEGNSGGQQCALSLKYRTLEIKAEKFQSTLNLHLLGTLRLHDFTEVLQWVKGGVLQQTLKYTKKKGICIRQKQVH